ncbi:hypothetical protein BJ912DRAFT_1145475 [Pholiota molesta]|nr:hypothetical protein BJ912DRAFT_1145475 [Pholiota molesta]
MLLGSSFLTHIASITAIATAVIILVPAFAQVQSARRLSPASDEASNAPGWSTYSNVTPPSIPAVTRIVRSTNRARKLDVIVSLRRHEDGPGLKGCSPQKYEKAVATTGHPARHIIPCLPDRLTMPDAMAHLKSTSCIGILSLILCALSRALT